MSSKTTLISPQRRALALGGSAALLLAACGGGGGTPAVVDDGTPDYGGRLPPGSVTMTITHKVTITVSMPDLTGVDLDTLDLAGFNALPTTTKTINLGLDRHHAPLSTDNFLAYLNSGAYANTIFHRVIEGFVVQGGGYTDTGGTLTHITTTGTVNLESRNGLANTRGTLAMARTDDANSATSEFYINLVNNVQLNYLSATSPGYAVFGTVMDDASMAVVAAIATLPTNSNDQPIRDVTITSIVLTS